MHAIKPSVDVNAAKGNHIDIPMNSTVKALANNVFFENISYI